MSKGSMGDMIGKKIQQGVGTLAGNVVDSTVSAVSQVVHHKLNPVSAAATRAVDEEDEADEADDSDDGANDESPATAIGLPLCFNIGVADENLEMAAAAWRLLGKDDRYDEPDIIAVQEDGRAFVGTVAQLDDYCEANDIEDGWDLWGVAHKSGNVIDYDTSEIREIKASKKALNRVLSACYSPEALEAARRQHDGFHWHEGSDPVTTITEVPGVHGVLAYLGIGEKLNYTSRKGGEVAVYTHDFGKKGVKPTVYALGDETIIIHGGKMVIEDRGIVH